MKTIIPLLLACSCANAGHLREGVSWFDNDAIGTPLERRAELTVCQSVVSGTPNELVYHTATNTAPMGVEVLIAYEPDKAPELWVYDWSKPEADSWTYLDDPQGRVCYRNITRALGGGWAENIVKLKRSGVWRIVYRNTYRQSDGPRMWWGPIVEEFPPGAADDMGNPGFVWKLKIDGKEWKSGN